MTGKGFPEETQVLDWEDVVNLWLEAARREDRDVVDDPPFDEARYLLEDADV